VRLRDLSLFLWFLFGRLEKENGFGIAMASMGICRTCTFVRCVMTNFRDYIISIFFR